MGMHVDRDEHAHAPVVSFSVGDSCTFRFGTSAGRGRPWTDVLLESGDLFVFGGPSRLAYHGVPKVLPETGDPAIGVGPGRFNVTVRQLGLPDPDGTELGVTVHLRSREFRLGDRSETRNCRWYDRLIH